MSPFRSSRPLRRVGAVLAAISVVVTVAACDVPPVGEALTATEDAGDRAPGGVLTTMSLGPVQTWDPQRIASRADAAFAARVFVRSLTAYQHGPDGLSQATLTGDLATDTGAADETLREWVFTLRDGIKWEDGSALTCEDVKYGISRPRRSPAGRATPSPTSTSPRRRRG